MTSRSKGKTAPKADYASKVPDRKTSESNPEVPAVVPTAKAVKPLSRTEKVVLQGLEDTIKSGLASFVEVGRALSKISAEQLYREEGETFEDYCERRWEISRQHGYRLMKASECFDKLKAELPKGTLLPHNESQLRPLIENLPPKQWVQAWKQALSDSLGVKMTAEVVEKVVRKMVGRSKPSTPLARKRVRDPMPTETMVRITKVTEDVLSRPRASASDLRKALEKIRAALRKLTTAVGS